MKIERKRRPYLGPVVRCRYHLDDPKKAGSMDFAALAEKARMYPHMKPCGKYGWNWIYRESCAYCPEGIRHE